MSAISSFQQNDHYHQKYDTNQVKNEGYTMAFQLSICSFKGQIGGTNEY